MVTYGWISFPDYKKYEGIKPYATELFGIYNTLLGWKSSQTTADADSIAKRALESVLRPVIRDFSGKGISDNRGASSIPDSLVRKPPYYIDSPLARILQKEIASFVSNKGKNPDRKQVLEILSKAKKEVEKQLDANKISSDGIYYINELGIAIIERDKVSKALAKSLAPHKIRGTELLAVNANKVKNLELADGNNKLDSRGQIIEYLATSHPDTLVSILKPIGKTFDVASRLVDPFVLLDQSEKESLELVSPIGLLQIFRQYFFELDSFLGPAVEHIWLSPGGMVELFEVHTDRKIIETETSLELETITKSEKAIKTQEEISERVSEENSRNQKFAISASGGVNFGVAKGSTSTEYSTELTRKDASEEAHKITREQSENISKEIRQKFKTTFKTTTEVVDTSSRKYVIQNKTRELVNYELRRKMRHILVQLQHIGTNLCWQLYIVDPGSGVHLPHLVHVAKPSNVAAGISPPEGPTVLPQQTKPMQVLFEFKSLDGQSKDDDTFFIPNGEGELKDDDGERIKSFEEYQGELPGEGYVLSEVKIVGVEGTNPDKDPPQFDAYQPIEIFERTKFRIRARSVNFEENPSIRLDLQLLWTQDEEQKKRSEEAYKLKWEEYNQKLQEAMHKAYVEAVRERVKMASNVPQRPSTDLREEERTILFRRVMTKLTKGSPDRRNYVTDELLRRLFDVDKMMYFVSPDWWMSATSSYSDRRKIDNINDTTRKSIFSIITTTNSALLSESTKAMIVAILTPFLMIPSLVPIFDNLITVLKSLKDSISSSGDKSEVDKKRMSDMISGLILYLESSLNRTHDKPEIIRQSDLVGWNNSSTLEHETYLITEDSRPAPFGASLGWTLQLDGDDHRNAFLNAPWVKVVIPIRSGREAAAIEWLKKAEVEFVEGLNVPYRGQKFGDIARVQNPTLEQALLATAKELETASNSANFEESEKVFQNGYDPMKGGFQWPADPKKPFPIFSQWTVVLSTNQVVAVEYDASKVKKVYEEDTKYI